MKLVVLLGCLVRCYRSLMKVVLISVVWLWLMLWLLLLMCRYMLLLGVVIMLISRVKLVFF